MEKGKIRDALLQTRRQDFKSIKLMGKRNMRIKSEMMRRNWEDKRKQSKSVKEQLLMAERKRKELEIQRLEKARKEFEDRIRRELRLTKQKEKEVMQMEMIEMELIKKLQNTQNIQKNAYQELENALAQPSVFFHNQQKNPKESSEASHSIN